MRRRFSRIFLTVIPGLVSPGAVLAGGLLLTPLTEPSFVWLPDRVVRHSESDVLVWSDIATRTPARVEVPNPPRPPSRTRRAVVIELQK